MKLYIAGPMTGYEYFNYPAFRKAEGQLRAAGHETLNPVDAEQHNTDGEPQSWEWYMRHALRMVTEADGVALLDGWEQSRGAQLEHHIASALRMPARPIAAWLA